KRRMVQKSADGNKQPEQVDVIFNILAQYAFVGDNKWFAIGRKLKNEDNHDNLQTRFEKQTLPDDGEHLRPKAKRKTLAKPEPSLQQRQLLANKSKEYVTFRKDKKTRVIWYIPYMRSRNVNFGLEGSLDVQCDEKLFVSTIFKMPCAYCGDQSKENGIDRMDDKIGYQLAKIVPCCEQC